MKERFIDTCWEQHNHTGELRSEVEEDPENELTQMIDQAKENLLFFDWEWEEKGNYDAVYVIQSETQESFCDEVWKNRFSDIWYSGAHELL